MAQKKDPRLARAGVAGFNKPKELLVILLKVMLL